MPLYTVQLTFSTRSRKISRSPDPPHQPEWTAGERHKLALIAQSQLDAESKVLTYLHGPLRARLAEDYLAHSYDLLSLSLGQIRVTEHALGIVEI